MVVGAVPWFKRLVAGSLSRQRPLRDRDCLSSQRVPEEREWGSPTRTNKRAHPHVRIGKLVYLAYAPRSMLGPAMVSPSGRAVVAADLHCGIDFLGRQQDVGLKVNLAAGCDKQGHTGSGRVVG
jgi:hypothetical protein